jgi:hypothetical protein
MTTALITIDSLKNYTLGAYDGEIGKISDFLFDDKVWGIRYLVADTRKWLPGRKVLVSPISIGSINMITKTVDVGLSKEQIKNSPPLDTDAPVSRQYEIFFNRYYSWSSYWLGSGLWGDEMYPRRLKSQNELLEIEDDSDGTPNLRSTNEVAGYRIHTLDEDIGHVEDFLIEEDTWIVRYLVIDTSNWIPGSKRVIVHPNWVDAVDWAEGAVAVRMTKEQVESCPEYNPDDPVNRDYEKSIFDHYKLPYYW